MRMKFVLVAAAAVFLVAATLWISWRRPAPAPASGGITVNPTPAAPSPSLRGASFGRQLELDIRRNGVTVEKAAQLFSLYFGELPGVAVPADARDPDMFCGTMAVSYISQVWRQLTDAQRAAVMAALAPSPAQRVGRVRPALGESGEPHLMLARFTAATGDAAKYDYLQMAKDADFAIAKRLNRYPILFGLDVGFESPKNKTAKAETYSWNLDNNNQVPDECHIHVFDPSFAALTFTDALSVMTHEMWHCYEQSSVGKKTDYLTIRNWLLEGQADWVMATIVPTANVYAGDWKDYVATPSKPFSERGQDAIGVYGHLADVMGSESGVWPRLLPAVSLGIGSDDLTPFLSLTQGYRLPYVTSWGSSYFLSGGRENWTMTGPGTVPSSGPSPEALFVPAGALQPLGSVGWFQAQILKLSSDADMLTVGLLTGFGRLHDEGYGIDKQLAAGDVVALCLKPNGCACPDGSPGASLTTKPAKGPIYVGLEGADDSAQAGVAAQSLDDFCKKPDPPVPPKDPGAGSAGGGDAGTNPPDQKPDGGASHDRDVHILTFDGARYDFQVVGEYTLVHSTVDDFTVQVREVPVLQSRTVSVNQAIATRIGGRRVTIATENGKAVLRLDGVPVTAEHSALSGGSIDQSDTLTGRRFQLEWPDGTAARVELEGKYLNTRITPSPARRGTLAGLLGNDNGSPLDDLVAADGSELPQPVAPDDVTHRLADAWRITQATSLFDYQPGESTATFTDPSFPDSHADPTSVPNRDAAEKLCRESGLTDRRLLDNCIVDYGMTNDFLFAGSYSRAQQLLAARARVPRPAPGVQKTIAMAGTIATPNSHPRVLFTAKAGDVAWIGGPDCTDNGMQGRVETPGGKAFGGGALCAIGRIVLPDTGQYSVTTPRDPNPLGRFSVPIRIVRPDRVGVVHYNDVVAGRIETRGTHDVYSFDGHEGDVLRIAGAGCEVGILVISVIYPNGSEALGPNCRAGSDMRLRQSGPFHLVMNGADGGFGAYHFVLQGAPGAPAR